MSSLRNAVQRRNHRERAQPLERQKWGLLEKRKDYKLRATDHKVKKRKINALKQKASERNEDEFYFGMMSSTSAGGIKRSKRHEGNSGGGGKTLAQDVVQLMKTQDRGYLQTMLQKTIRERERLEEEVLLLEKGVDTALLNKRKVVFGQDNEISASTVDLKFSSTDAEADAASGESDEDMVSVGPKPTHEKQHQVEVKRRKLESLKEQEEKLSDALHEVNEQRAKMNGSSGGVNKHGVKFKQRERKR